MSTKPLTRNCTMLDYAGLKQGEQSGSSPADLAEHSYRVVQVEGTFGIGGMVEILGSNDGKNFRILTDNQGAPLRLTVPCIKDIEQSPLFVMANVSAGDDTTSLDVTFICRRSRTL